MQRPSSRSGIVAAMRLAIATGRRRMADAVRAVARHRAVVVGALAAASVGALAVVSGKVAASEQVPAVAATAEAADIRSAWRAQGSGAAGPGRTRSLYRSEPVKVVTSGSPGLNVITGPGRFGLLFTLSYQQRHARQRTVRAQAPNSVDRFLGDERQTRRSCRPRPAPFTHITPAAKPHHRASAGVAHFALTTSRAAACCAAA